jgi:hypothetical protein
MLPFEVLTVRETNVRHSLIRSVGRPPVVYSWKCVYICVCAFVRVRGYVSTHLCIYLCMSVCVYMCLDMYVCVCICLCMSVINISMYVYVCILCLCLCVCTSKHTVPHLGQATVPMRRIVMPPSFICSRLVIIKSPHVRSGHHP